MLKLVTAYCEQGGNITASTGNAANSEVAASAHKLAIRAPTSQLVCEAHSTEMHFVHAIVLAELHALVQSANSSDTLRNEFVAPTVRTTVQSMLQEHAVVLSPLWHALVVDATRVSYFVAKSHTASSVHQAGTAVDSLFGVAPVAAAATSAGAVTVDSALMLSHPLRGGLTYSSSAASTNTVVSASVVMNKALQDTLFDAVPSTLAAFIHCATAPPKTLLSPKGKSAPSQSASGHLAAPTIESAQVLPLFAVAQMSLQVVLSGTQKACLSAVAHLLASFIALARKDSPASANLESFAYTIPLEEWSALLKLLLQHITRLSSPVALNSLAELVSVLAERVVHAKNAGSAQVSVDQLWLTLWNFALILTNRYESRLFAAFPADKSSAGVVTPALNSAAVLAQNSTTEVTLAAASSVFVVKALVCLATVKEALASYVSHLLSLILLSETARSANGSSSSAAVLETISSALAAQRSIGPQLCVQLLQNMHDWLGAHYQIAGAAEAVASKVVDVSLAVWRLVALSLDAQVLLAYVLVCSTLTTKKCAFTNHHIFSLSFLHIYHNRRLSPRLISSTRLFSAPNRPRSPFSS